MNSVLPHNSFLALNNGKFRSEKLRLSRGYGLISVTSHFETGFRDIPHFHENTHLCFLLSGAVLDKRKGFETERASGELLFFHAGEPHQTTYEGFHVKNISIEFEASFFEENCISESAFDIALFKEPAAKFTMLRIYKELLTHDSFSEASIEMLALSLTDGYAAPKNYPSWLGKIRQILNDRWNEELSVSDLAAAANVHPKTISKHFPRYFSCTLGEYRRRLRIEKSLSLVKTSKHSLTDIAYQCGFFDQSHFTRTFKEVTGFLPKRYRKL